MIVSLMEWDDPVGLDLRDAQRREVSARYDSPDSEPGPAPTAKDITAFFVAFSDDGEPLGCAGLRERNPTEAEIKRMYVVPAHRGTGVSSALLLQLERFGRERGWQRLVLETGAPQPEAIRFYEREGFTRIPNFGYYEESADSLCFEKPLFLSDPAAEIDCEGCQ